jgi:hypothetical protein
MIRAIDRIINDLDLHPHLLFQRGKSKLPFFLFKYKDVLLSCIGDNSIGITTGVKGLIFPSTNKPLF